MKVANYTSRSNKWTPERRDCPGIITLGLLTLLQHVNFQNLL